MKGKFNLFMAWQLGLCDLWYYTSSFMPMGQVSCMIDAGFGSVLCLKSWLGFRLIPIKLTCIVGRGWSGYLLRLVSTLAAKYGMSFEPKGRLVENDLVSKRSFIGWFAVNDRLSTWDRLAKSGTMGDLLCVFCRRQMECKKIIFFGSSLLGGFGSKP